MSYLKDVLELTVVAEKIEGDISECSKEIGKFVQDLNYHSMSKCFSLMTVFSFYYSSLGMDREKSHKLLDTFLDSSEKFFKKKKDL